MMHKNEQVTFHHWKSAGINYSLKIISILEYKKAGYVLQPKAWSNQIQNRHIEEAN